MSIAGSTNGLSVIHLDRRVFSTPEFGGKMKDSLNATNLHRTAKYFMDSGRAKTHEEAMGLLNSFGLTIHVDSSIANSIDHQAALFTLVNLARRTLLSGIEVIGVPNAPSLSAFALGQTMAEAVVGFGGRLVNSARPDWPSALIGNIPASHAKLPAWRLTWSGWRGGVVPISDGRRLLETRAIGLAPILAAAACAAEVFSYHAKDHVMAGFRVSGLSLWRPGSDWLIEDVDEPFLSYLPSQLWFIGLGNLGQAFSWVLASLRFADPKKVKLVLQDFDRIAVSNESTSLLSFVHDLNRRKARVVAEWLDQRGFDTFIEERIFGGWTKRSQDEPAVALCGVDNPLARASLEKSGFGLVIEAGLGGGPQAFRSFSMHTFPASQSADEIWSRQVGQKDVIVESMPAYLALQRSGMESCGLATLASRAVGVPFVGLIAACLVFSELLRRLNGGQSYEVVSGSAASLGDVETVAMLSSPYAFGHILAATN